MSYAKGGHGLLQDFFKVTRLPHDPFAKTFLDRCQSHTIKANGTFYKYFQRGSGPTVLLVHGVHSNLGSMVTIAEELLKQDYQVVLFDAPAHGEALGKTADPIEVRELVGGIYDRLGELHAVISHSLGGLWALSAWNGNARAKAFISISSPSNEKFLVEKFAELNELDGDTVDALIGQIESRFGKEEWSEFSPSKVVKKANIPGLIIHGTHDDYVSPKHAEDLNSNWRQSTMKLIKDADHFNIVESSKVRKILTTYLREVK